VKAIILTAGEGAHFRPLTVTRPKGMSLVAGRPILHHTVEALVEAGIQDCTFVVGYKPERVRAFFGSGKPFGIEAHYVTQERPEGTGNALRLAVEHLRPKDETLVLFGDNRYTADLIRTVLAIHGDVVLGTSASDPKRNGLLVAKSGRLVRYEYPSGSDHGLVNTGLMKFTPRFFDHLRAATGDPQLPTLLDTYVQAGHAVHVQVADQGWDEADEVWDLLRMNEHLLDDITFGTPPTYPGVRIEGYVTVGANTLIRPGAQIIGPVHIGSDCEIRENAVVGPYVSLRNSVHVGAGTEIRHSLVNNNVFIDSQCVVRFSILDDGTRLGPFDVLAEGASDAQDGQVPARRGAVIGPDARLGARVTVRPGSVLGEDSQVADGHIVGDLEARARAA
jgi:UDP-N-acetylglucosamine diphosphorylase / glucose-1-phosphate thymidylyltransferase / UDP-N-acetylgalactosamine diphosphorylase / glucosamine-1-phosphate N-acetyltransferase / galactosamine-1-phosphate N-acetyltransferase